MELYRKKDYRSKICLFISIFVILLTGSIALFSNNTNIAENDLNLKISAKNAAELTPFISIWNTSAIRSGSSAYNEIQLPLVYSGNYDFIINWGDSSSDTITAWDQDETNHTYSVEGVYTIQILGTIEGWNFHYNYDRLKIIEIQQWGCLQLGNSASYFQGCSNLKLTATDELNLTGTSNLSYMFNGCYSLGDEEYIDHWDVSDVTAMSFMFWDSTSFNLPIGNWDVSQVHHMNWMFFTAHSFNQSIENWDVSSVTTMERMFTGADSFNQPLGNWDVSSVTNMVRMFGNTPYFNQPLDSWDVSSVTTMELMFYYASSFNQPLGNWDVSNVRNMEFMFASCLAFDQPLGSWDVSNVENMNVMFNEMELSVSNYDNLLNGWAQLSLQTGINFDGGKSQYSNYSITARQYIIDTFSWTITDFGMWEGSFDTTNDTINETTDEDTTTNEDSTNSEGENFEITGYSTMLLLGLAGISFVGIIKFHGLKRT